MQGKMTAALQARVKAEMVDSPLMERMGLQDGDLFGAASSATAALRAGDMEAAFKGFAHLVLLDPTNAHFHAGLAEVALELGHHSMALQSASVVVATDPTSPDGYFLSARACLGLGEPKLALEDLAETERLAQKSGKTAIQMAAQKMKALIGDAEMAAK